MYCHQDAIANKNLRTRYTTLLPALISLEFQESHDHGFDGDQGVVGHPIFFSPSFKPLWLSKELSKQDTCDCCHSPASIHPLSFRVPFQAFWVSSESQRIESKISWHTSIKMFWGLCSWEPQGSICCSAYFHTGSGPWS